MLNKSIAFSLALMSPLPVWATNNEAIPTTEALATQQIVTMIEQQVATEARNGKAHRGAHAKGHGCVKAAFRVLPQLPDEVRFGLFKAPRTFPAWIRYSNGSAKIQEDSIGDARGMAIKLMDVEHSKSGTQDLVMINYPVFFVRNAADYVEFQQAQMADSPLTFFLPGFNPFAFRLHELGIVNAIKNKRMTNPLDAQYWSMTPYRLGNTAMKFSARPCGGVAQFTDTATPNFLRDNMQKQLIQGEACFDFSVQLQRVPAKMPLEDPTLEWREEDSAFIRVAEITLPKQTFTSAEQLALCERFSFTPWHTMPEHQPLGGINRIRKTVYEASARVRQDLNGKAP